MAEATEHLRLVISAQDQASGVIKNLGTEVNGFIGSMAKGAAAGVGFFLAQQAQQAIGGAFDTARDAVIGFNAAMEQSRLGWATILGGAQQAEAMLTQLQRFADSTPFEFEDAERAARRFAAMGFTAGQIIPLMRSVAAAAAATGSGSVGIDRISRALGQMQTRTKVTAEDMMQLTEVGVPAWQILADATGTSVAQIQDAVTKGKVSSEVMISAFQNFAVLKWGDLLSADTFDAVMSNISDSSKRLLSNTFRPLFDGLKELGKAFLDFLRSEGVANFGQAVKNAQQAVALFIGEIAKSESVLTVFKGALLGIAAVLGVQMVQATVRASASMAVFLGTIAVANAPLLALMALAAAAGIVVVTNWDSISKATAELVSSITQSLAPLVEWLGTMVESIVSEWTTGWQRLGERTVEALNAIGQVWNAFWGQQFEPSHKSAMETLLEVASAGYARYVEIAVGAFEKVLQAWNLWVQAITNIRQAVPSDIPLPFNLDQFVGKFADVERLTKTYQDFLAGQPALLGGIFSGTGKFFHEILPVAIGKAVEAIQAAGGSIAELWPKVQEILSQTRPELIDEALDTGKNAGRAFGQGVVDAARPILEELARMMAQQRAAPISEALEQTQAVIERNKLLLQVRGVPAEVRAAARRQIRELTANVLPLQQLEAFDAERDVKVLQNIENAAKLRLEIAKTQRELADGTSGGSTALGAGGAPATGGAPSAVAPSSAIVDALTQLRDKPVSVALHIEVTTDGGPPRIFEELIEANGQAQTPPVIQVSAVRRS